MKPESTEQQRAQWDEHREDEVRAIAEQQVTAGTAHRPLAAHAPHTENDLIEAARAAAAAERERCAVLAAAVGQQAQLDEVLPGAGPQEIAAARTIALHIAQLLRAGQANTFQP